jgi:DNA invertase Pin-like site-specific DNA recombinase
MDKFKGKYYLIYARVSTNKESQETSIPNQIETCEKFCKENGILPSPGNVFKDDGISGTGTKKRSGLLAILEKVSSDYVIVATSGSRLSRNFDQMKEIEVLVSTKKSAIICLDTIGYEGNKAIKNIMQTISNINAEEYVVKHAIAVKAGLQKARERGVVLGRPKYGWMRDPITKLLVPDLEKMKKIHAIREICRLNPRIHPLEIITEMEKINLPHSGCTSSKRKGDVPWKPNLIKKIIENNNIYHIEHNPDGKRLIDSSLDKIAAFEEEEDPIVTPAGANY